MIMFLSIYLYLYKLIYIYIYIVGDGKNIRLEATLNDGSKFKLYLKV